MIGPGTFVYYAKLGGWEALAPASLEERYGDPAKYVGTTGFMLPLGMELLPEPVRRTPPSPEAVARADAMLAACRPSPEAVARFEAGWATRQPSPDGVARANAARAEAVRMGGAR